MKQQQALLCLAEGRDGNWEGICLDFDIAVQGGSLEEVQRLLADAVGAYIRDALHEDDATQARLLHRRVPFLTQLLYRLRFAAAAFRNGRSGDLHGAFQVPCHA